MEPNTAKIIVLCIIGVAIIDVAYAGIEIKDLTITNIPNEYVGDVKTDVKNVDGNSLISVTVPLLKDIGEGFEIKANLNFNKIPILNDMVMPICEAISEDGFFKPVISQIEPAGKFPSTCPVPAGEYKVNNFKIDMSDYLPFGIVPTGDFDARVEIVPSGEPNGKSIATISASGSLTSSGGLVSLGSLLN